MHISEGYPTVIGNNVTIGHKSIIHGCEIGDNTLIGMGSIVLDGAKIGEFTLLGAPAKVIRELSEQEKENLTKSALKYVKLANNHK